MPEIMNCPQCDGKLRVPDELLGCSVQCPTCGITFTAPAGAHDHSSPETIQPDDAPGPEPSQTREYEDAPDLLCQRQLRADLPPHRGTLILVLGILSIVIPCCGLLGPIAWVMANHDLKEIRALRMDPQGRGTTEGGRVCGIIGTTLNLVLPLCCGLPSFLLWALFSFREVAH